ncbi:MAG: PEP-CTERM sorting domain-containing protein, partial [Planctomycetota bacterium]
RVEEALMMCNRSVIRLAHNASLIVGLALAAIFKEAKMRRVVICLVVVNAFAVPTHGATKHWKATTGNWGTGTNWSPSGEPTSSDTVWIDKYRATATVSSYGERCAALYIDANATLRMISGSLTSGSAAPLGDEYIGRFGRGTVVQSGGVHYSRQDVHLGYLPGGNGTYRLSSGTHNITGELNLALFNGSTGTYGLSGGGRLSASQENIGDGGSGRFIQTGGTNTVSGDLYVGRYSGSGTYTISGGTLDVRKSGFPYGRIRVGYGTTGTFNLNGGTVIANSFILESDGIFNSSGSGSTLRVNRLTGFGDNMSFPGSLEIGHTTGWPYGDFTLNAGQSLSVGERLVIGYDDSGRFTQTGGAVSNADGYVGRYSGSNGTATVTGTDSRWTNTGSLYIGGDNSSAGGSGSLYVNDGATVTVGDTMKIWSTGSVEVTDAMISAGTIQNAGSLVNNGTISGNVLNQSGGLLTGSGIFEDAVTIAAGSLVSPGDSPGTMNWGSGLLEGGGTLLWEINDATGIAGLNWDLIAIDDTLNITATALNPFLIDMDSLLPDNNPGLLANFDNMQSYGWTFLTAGGGISGFSADYFLLEYSGFYNDLGGGNFWLSQVGNSLNLNFQAIPEPSSLVLWGIGIITVLGYSLRRRKGAA